MSQADKKGGEKKQTDLGFGHSVSKPIIPDGEERRVHRFWDSQPVPKVTESEPVESGPVDVQKTIDQIPASPLPLPPQFEWCVPDITKGDELAEVAELLALNYVEDDDACFRFDYSPESIVWALTPPGYQKDWHIGVRANGKLVAFISAIPATISVHGKVLKVAEVNFLCVHKKLRHKRLAPVLIKEVTRRVNRTDVWQAIYTAGVFLPRPVAQCQYWHRSIKIRKLVDVGFTQLPPKQTMAIAERLFSLPSAQTLSGIRPAEDKDVPAITKLFAEYCQKSKPALHPVFTEEEAKHWLTPRGETLHSYVREIDGKVTDFFTFYSLPSQVIKHNAHHKQLEVAYAYYTVNTSVTRKQLMQEALIAAKLRNFDVFNCLDLSGNREVMEDLKFGRGDGCLRYYLYNWKCPAISTDDVTLFLL